MRDAMLKRLARWHTDSPWRMIIIVSALTLLFGGLSTRLTQTMRWSDLLPSGNKHTIAYNKVLKEFVTASSIVVVVQGEEKRIKEFTETIVPRIMSAKDTTRNVRINKQMTRLENKMRDLREKGGNEAKISTLAAQIESLRGQIDKELVQRIDYKMETDFLRDHGLMLLKAKDLKNMKEVFTDPNLAGLLYNINNSLEKEYVGSSESISTREKEDQAVGFLDGIENWVILLNRYLKGESITEDEAHDAVDRLLFGESYFLSYDKNTLILNVIPNFTVFDIDRLVSGTKTIQTIVDDVLEDFPGVESGLTGMIPLCHDEMVYAEKSLGYTSVIALAAILILLMISFRMWIAPMLAILNLVVGTIWATGVAAVVVGQLNIMTSMFAVVLLGLGVDFSIHLISGFTENRATGKPISEATRETFLKSGRGILTGALTTACAFLTMTISSSRGMKEMGLVTGAGLLAILAATFLFLPSLLVLRERKLDSKRRKEQKTGPAVRHDISFGFLGRIAQALSRGYAFTIAASVIVTALLLWFGVHITFDQNYMNIEAKGLTSIALQDTVLEKFDLSMDYALVLADDVNESREVARKYREIGSVATTEDISIYLPSPEQQQERVPYLEEIKMTMTSAPVRTALRSDELPILWDEIRRLKLNVMEMQDMAFLGGQDKVDNKCKEIVGDPEQSPSTLIIDELLYLLRGNSDSVMMALSDFQAQYASYFKESVLRMCSTDPLSLEDLPVSILDRYSNKDRSHFLITVFPEASIWQRAEFLERFANDLERVSDKATGFPPVFHALIEIIGRDGRNSALLTLVIVFLLLWLDFRRPGYALIAAIPLAIGAVWMIGIMKLVGMQLTVVNVMGLPMILGIGIDDGVHIIHRWAVEGEGKVKLIFASTGKAILLTSLTTMLAFGALLFSVWRGFAQLGGALSIGVGACFLTTIVLLSGIIGMVEKNRDE